MALTTYAELLTSLGNWLNRDDLTDQLPDFIRIAESRMNRYLRVPQMELTVEQAVSDGTTALPVDFLELRSLYIDDDPDRQLVGVPPHELRRRYPTTTSGTPEVYAIEGQTLTFGPSPAEAEIVVINYFREITPLSDDNTTNWLLEDYPDAYLWGALAAAEAYAKDKEQAMMWKAQFDETLGEIMSAGRKMAAPHQLVQRPMVSN